jgi:hypothetical protein
VLSHAGHLKERAQPYRTAVTSRVQCSNLGHLIWESCQVNKTKRQRPHDLTVHTHSSLSPSVIILAAYDVIVTAIVTTLDFDHHISDFSAAHDAYHCLPGQRHHGCATGERLNGAQALHFDVTTRLQEGV